MSVKNILMIVGDYVEDYEAMVPYQMLTMVGHTVHTVCPGKSAGEPDIIMAGGKWAEPDSDFANAYTDKNLVTAAAWPAHPSWMRQFLKLLGSTIET